MMAEELPKQVVEIAEGIKTMKIRGAGRIARAAAQALIAAAQSWKGDSLREFKSYMRRVASYLLSTRPTAVSLPNAVNYVIRVLDDRNLASVEEARRAVVGKAEEFIERSLKAVETIGEIGSRLIETGMRILTHCNSNAVESILIKAWKQGKRFEVYATETRPRFQGHITARNLAREGIPVILIPDAAVYSVMADRKISMVLVGADTVTANGAVINKIGTSQIALAAKSLGIRFVVAAETYKFSPYTVVGQPVEIEERPWSEVVSEKPTGVEVSNPAFDATPPDYIDMVITELGVIPPKSAALLLWEVFGRQPFMKSEVVVEDSEQ
ncbi:MAG: ribose 1,5-bisphosphate isomerase [Thermoproteota archaeon]